MVSVHSYFCEKFQQFTLGCLNASPVLCQEDLDFIADHTAIARDEINQHYNNFLSKYPDGKISRRGFADMMKACFPSRDTTQLESHIFRIYDCLTRDGKWNSGRKCQADISSV